MQWPGPTLLVTAPAVAHPPAADLFDREAVDPVDGLGPLRGVLTALGALLYPKSSPLLQLICPWCVRLCWRS